jgi:hypothetical protein
MGMLATKSIRIVILLGFSFLAALAFAALFYGMILSAFGLAAHQEQGNIFSMIWEWREFLFVTLTAAIAFYGILQNRKPGIFFGYVTVYYIFGSIMLEALPFVESSSSFYFSETFTEPLLYLMIGSGLFFGLRHLEKEKHPLTKRELIQIAAIAIVFLLLER